MDQESPATILDRLRRQTAGTLDRRVEMLARCLEEDLRGNDRALADALDLVRMIDRHGLHASGACDECDSWNGMDKRCSCGNRRVYWRWNEGVGAWVVEAY